LPGTEQGLGYRVFGLQYIERATAFIDVSTSSRR
jgi:hypothetical protein